MGFTTAPYSVFAADTRQTPYTVAMVLDFAGWTYKEASEQIGVAMGSIMDGVLSDEKWRELLDKAGRRAFDFDEESA